MRAEQTSFIADSLERNHSTESLLRESKDDPADIESNSSIPGTPLTPRRHLVRLWVAYQRHLYLLIQVIQIGFALYGIFTLIFPTGFPLRHSTGPGKDPYGITYDDEGAVVFDKHPCDCGSSVAEALSNGCVYDELSAAWLPERCRDDALTAQFATIGDGSDGHWMYWAHKNRTGNLTVHEVSLYSDIQPTQYHMSYEWHVWHCLYLWLKEHRFKINGKYFDPRADSEHHIMHCIDVLTETRTNTMTAAGASLNG
ncbi:hypothetical protein N7466_000856 [Penicillium verhagenii]|uniref:uncharacterized protein n=1 Tax=Penicillium verhagenii TaxID=1562060 RepID=UPI00254568FC|nr:uncharacterized protein N7466_000856 [Penicillium verhagenii]KAJ5947841.1 hypothetical protein N7466_000856 [Penicillium verhagenii]